MMTTEMNNFKAQEFDFNEKGKPIENLLVDIPKVIQSPINDDFIDSIYTTCSSILENSPEEKLNRSRILTFFLKQNANYFIENTDDYVQLFVGRYAFHLSTRMGRKFYAPINILSTPQNDCSSSKSCFDDNCYCTNNASNFDSLKEIFKNNLLNLYFQEEEENAGKYGFTMYMPHWALLLFEKLNGSYIHDEEELDIMLSSLTHSHLSDDKLYNMLKHEKPQLIDNVLQLLSLERKIKGINIQISNIERSIAKLDPSQRNNIQAREVTIDNLVKELQYVYKLIDKNKELRSVYLNKFGTVNTRNNNVDGFHFEYPPITAHPSMDANQQNETVNIEDQSQNTALGATAIDVQEVIMVKEPDTAYISEVMTDTVHMYPDLTERWILIDTVKLTTTINQGDVIKIMHLPADAIIQNWDTPNSLPFRNHEFFIGDLDLKLQWNVPKTNQFAAAVGVYYHWLQRDRPVEVINAWTVSQMPGGLLNGHTKNSVEIPIPYMSHHPMIPIRKNNFAKNLYFVTVVVIAMTPFEVSTGGVDKADLNFYFKFGKNLRFFGQRTQEQNAPEFEPFVVAKPSMMAFGASLFKGVAGTLVSSANQIVSTTLTTATKGVINATEKVISKALPSKGNRDKPTSLGNEAFHIRATTNIASGSANFAADRVSLIQSSSATHPDFLVGREKYDSLDAIIHKQGFINSFKINVTDHVGTQLCKMKIHPSSVEQFSNGLFNADNINNWAPVDHIAGWFLNYAMKMKYTFLPIVDGFKTFRFRVVFAVGVEDLTFEESNSYYYETFDVGSDLNTQVCFEFITPYITSMLNYNMQTVDGNQPLNYGVLAVFLETAINMPENLVDHCSILVYKSAAEGTAVLSVPRDNTSLLVYDPSTIPSPPIPNPPPPGPPVTWQTTVIRVSQSSLNVTSNNWNGVTQVSINPITINRNTASSTTQTVVLTAAAIRNLFDHNENAVGSTNLVLEGTWNPSTIRISMWGRVIAIMSASDLAAGEIFEIFIQYQGTTPVPSLQLEEITAIPSMDRGSSTIDLTPKLTPANEAIHGESHMDLQTNLRRFNLFYTGVINAPNSSNFTTVLKLPLNFGAAQLREELNQLQRSDKIIHLHDAFRFTRGSLRLLFVFQSANPAGNMLFEHIPQATNYPFTDSEQQVQSQKLTTGFGESVCSLQQNNTHVLEFPMYLPGSSILNAAYTSEELQTKICQGLGIVKLQWQGNAREIKVSVFRSFADDTAMYLFNGFPLRNQIQQGPAIPFYPPAVVAKPSMFKSNMTHSLDEESLNALKALKDINVSLDFNKVMPSSGGQSIIITMITQIGHIVNNPTMTTFVLAGTEMLNALGFFSMESIKKAESFFSSAWQYLFGKGDTITAIPTLYTSKAGEFASMIYASISAYFGVKKMPKDLKNFAFVKETSSNYSKVVSFFSSLLAYIKEIVISFCESWFPKSSFLAWLKDDVYTTWVKVATILSDETVFSRIKRNPELTQLVFATVDVGNELVIKLATTKRAAGDLGRLVQINLMNLTKVRNKLGKNSQVPIVKYEPFVYYIGGSEAQIGKSTMLEEISRAIADCAGVEGLDIDSPIYIVPTDPYWESYDDHKIIHFDDVNRTQRTEIDQTDTSRMVGLTGPALFTVPIAFEGKGKTSSCVLIGCASNYLYPKVNGMKDEVIWNRRHVLFDCYVKPGVLSHCDEHANFRFQCHRCVKVNNDKDPDILAKRQYLSFQEMDPKKPQTKILTETTFEGMRDKICNSAMNYYKIHNEIYKKRVEEHCARMKISKEEFAVPQSVMERFNKLISEPKVVMGLDSLGFFTERTNPTMFKSFFGRKQEEEEEVDIEMQNFPKYCIHLDLTKDSECDFNRNGYIFPENGATHAKCFDGCVWHTMESSFMVEWYVHQDLKGSLPTNFPQRLCPYMETHVNEAVKKEMEKIEEESWYKKREVILGAITAVIAVIGAGLLIWRTSKKKKKEIVEDSENEDEEEEEEEEKPVKKEKKKKAEVVHAALMASGDVKTKFVSRFSTKKNATRSYKAVPVSPSQDDELKAMIDTYKKAIVEVTCPSLGESIARAVCIEKGYFLTQFHSLATFLHKISAEILKVLKSQKTCTSKCSDQGNSIVHCPECVDAANAKFPLNFKRISKSNALIDYQMSLKQFIEYNGGSFAIDHQGSDIVIFSLPSEVTTTNISKYLSDDTSINWADSKKLHVCDPGRFSEPHPNACLPLKEVESKQIRVCYENECWTEQEKAYFLIYGYSAKNEDYDRFSTACGSVIYDPVNLKILGFQSSITSSSIYFNSFSKAEVKEAIGQCVTLNKVMKGLNGQDIKLKERNKFVDITHNVYTTTPAMKIYHSTKTAIRPSVCHKKFGSVVREPCNISQNGDSGETAFVNGISNYEKHQAFPKADIEEAYEDVSNMMCREAKPGLVPVESKRNLQEAVCGIAGHITRLTMQTSPGFPWCCYPNTKKKSDLLEFDDSHNLTAMQEDLFNLLEENDAKMKNGEVPMTIYQISHKDERLSFDKLNNVRLIQGSPLDLTISARQHFMDFNYAFQINRFNLEHRVGINPASLEWDEMASGLINFSPYICVGDYSKFGPRLLTEFVDKAYQIMNDWYTAYGKSEDNDVRTILGKRATNCFNLAYDSIFELECGSPSGAFNTVIVNSLCNMLYIRCAWIGIMKQNNITLSSLDQFQKYVKFICYGDDVIFAVKPEVIEIFNNQTICDYFKGFGVKYTDITKGSEMRKYCTIEEASFLKCGFRFFTETSINPGVWICLPQLEDIKDTTNWVRKPKGLRAGADITGILSKGSLDNCNDAIRKMWFFGEDAFNEFQNKVIDFWTTQDPDNVPKRISYRGLQREYGIPNKEDSITSLNEFYVMQGIISGKALEVERVHSESPQASSSTDILASSTSQLNSSAPLDDDEMVDYNANVVWVRAP
nr:MAG: polyprotein [Picornavirales sp.]